MISMKEDIFVQIIVIGVKQSYNPDSSVWQLLFFWCTLVNMLQDYTPGCYYWSWYLERRGRQQISTTTNRCIDHWQWQWRKPALTHTATSDHNRPREFHCNYVDITSLLWRNVHAETFAFQSCHAVIHRFCLSVTQCTFLRSLLSACGLSYIFVVPLWPWRFLAVDCDGYNITFPPGTTVIFLKL